MNSFYGKNTVLNSNIGSFLFQIQTIYVVLLVEEIIDYKYLSLSYHINFFRLSKKKSTFFHGARVHCTFNYSITLYSGTLVI